MEEKVIQYLIKNYDIDEEGARQAVKDHQEYIEQGERLGSFPYFVGDKIAASLDLDENEEEDEEDEKESYDDEDYDDSDDDLESDNF